MNSVQKSATEISPGLFWRIRPWRIQIFWSQSRFITKKPSFQSFPTQGKTGFYGTYPYPYIHGPICSAAQFEQLSTIIAKHGQQSMQEMMHAAAQHKLLPVFKALQYMTFQTANIPLTQGYKVSLRQLGFGLNVYDGPLTVFLTTNFADM